MGSYLVCCDLDSRIQMAAVFDRPFLPDAWYDSGNREVEKKMTENWQPNLNDVIQRLPDEKLLRKACELVLRAQGDFPIKDYKDSHGVYAKRYGHFLLCAKKEIYGNVVSVHEDLVLEGIKLKRPIVMYIRSAGKFYSFNPYEIMKDCERNEKGLATMLNFKISLGKNLEW